MKKRKPVVDFVASRLSSTTINHSRLGSLSLPEAAFPDAKMQKPGESKNPPETLGIV
jgi:hypothetical protein